MSNTVKSIRVDPETASDIERLSPEQRTTFSALAAEMLCGAAKMRRCPGVVFADGPAGRRARIEGTGIEVWEVISSYLALGRDERRHREAYHWLSERQILAALGYGRTYPRENDYLILTRELFGRIESHEGVLVISSRLAPDDFGRNASTVKENVDLSGDAPATFLFDFVSDSERSD